MKGKMNGRKKNKTLLVQDGISENQPTDFQSFLAYPIAASHRSLNIHLPQNISDHMKLTTYSLLQVAIRYIPIKEAKEEYGKIPEPHKLRNRPKIKKIYNTSKYTGKQSPRFGTTAPKVLCPVCNRIGRLHIIHGTQTYRRKNGTDYTYERKPQIQVAHGVTDGFNIIEVHSISKRAYPEFYKKHLSIVTK